MTNHTPFPISPLVGDLPGDQELYTGEELRQWIRSMAELSHGFTGSRTGVMSLTSCKVSQRGAGPTMSVDVAPGRLFIFGGDSPNQGVYFAWSDAIQNIAVPTTPSGTRIHRVAAQLRDKSENGSWTDYAWQPVLLADTGGGTPALPVTYANLGLVGVASTDSSVTNSMITDIRELYGRFQQVIRTTDSSTRSTTATTTDDDTLVLSNLAVGTHKIRAQIFYRGGTAGDFKFGWRTAPSVTGAFSALRTDETSVVALPARYAWSENHRSQCGGTTKPDNSRYLNIEGVMVVPSNESVVSGGGVLRQIAFQWAQWSSASIGATVEDFSSLISERIA